MKTYEKSGAEDGFVFWRKTDGDCIGYDSPMQEFFTYADFAGMMVGSFFSARRVSTSSEDEGSASSSSSSVASSETTPDEDATVPFEGESEDSSPEEAPLKVGDKVDILIDENPDKWTKAKRPLTIAKITKKKITTVSHDGANAEFDLRNVRRHVHVSSKK